MYLFGFTDYEAGFTFGNDAELTANRDNLVKAIAGATMLTSDTITMRAPRARIHRQRHGTRLITSRVFIVGLRPYMLAVMTPLNQNRSENIRRFLASFTPPK